MMNDMIERVARAIWFADGQPDEFETYATEMREKAVAAIEAMRDPTNEMTEHALPHMDSWSSNLAWWNAMIDAASRP